MIAVPAWATEVLSDIGREVGGILEYPIPKEDPGIAHYEAIGGAQFLARSAIPYAMTSLDAPVYHRYLVEFGGQELDSVIVDVGGGDGRNALPWLERGFVRLVVVDPISAALKRLRQWLAQNRPEWLPRVLLVRADARQLPIRSAVAKRVFAIESLYYLNEEEPAAVAECLRILAPDGRFLIADRDWEGGLVARLLHYGGVEGMLRVGRARNMWDGPDNHQVRSRLSTEPELRRLLENAGLEVLSVRGISGMSLILGFLRSIERLGDGAEARLEELQSLLQQLGEKGQFRRAHVAVARRKGDL